MDEKKRPEFNSQEGLGSDYFGNLENRLAARRESKAEQDELDKARAKNMGISIEEMNEKEEQRKKLQREEEWRQRKFDLYGNIGVIKEIKTGTGKNGKPYHILNVNWKGRSDSRGQGDFFINDIERLKTLKKGMEIIFSSREIKQGTNILDKILISRESVVSERESSEEVFKKAHFSSRVELSKEKKLEIALKKGALPVDRQLSFLAWELRDGKTARIIAGKLDHFTFWVAAVIGKAVYDVSRYDHNFPTFTLPEIEEMEKDFGTEEGKQNAPQLKFTAKELKRYLGKPNLKTSQIDKIMSRLSSIVIQVEDFRGYKDETGEWVAYGPWKGQLFPVESKDSENQTMRRYTVSFSTVFSMISLNNIARSGMHLVPQRFFHLSGNAQRLFCPIFWMYGKVYLTFGKILQILNWKEPKYNQGRHTLKKRIASYLNELKEGGFIKDWRMRGPGSYELTKHRNILKQRRSLKDVKVDLPK